jgi:hypothetical protein
MKTNRFYAVRIENVDSVIEKIMDVPGYSHLSYKTTRSNGFECKYVYIQGKKSDIIKNVKTILKLPWGYFGAVYNIFNIGDETFYN